jgi:hypothetical protein
VFGALTAAGVRLGKTGRDLVQQSAGIIVLNLILGFTVFRFVSNAAHIGGLIAGLAFGFALFRMPQHLVTTPGGAPVSVADGTTYEGPDAIAASGDAPPRPIAPAHDPHGPTPA